MKKTVIKNVRTKEQAIAVIEMLEVSGVDIDKLDDAKNFPMAITFKDDSLGIVTKAYCQQIPRNSETEFINAEDFLKDDTDTDTDTETDVTETGTEETTEITEEVVEITESQDKEEAPEVEVDVEATEGEDQ